VGIARIGAKPGKRTCRVGHEVTQMVGGVANQTAPNSSRQDPDLARLRRQCPVRSAARGAMIEPRSISSQGDGVAWTTHMTFARTDGVPRHGAGDLKRAIGPRPAAAASLRSKGSGMIWAVARSQKSRRSLFEVTKLRHLRLQQAYESECLNGASTWQRFRSRARADPPDRCTMRAPVVCPDGTGRR
jgi:hypothetical protein